MSTLTESLIRSWKHGHEVVVQEVESTPKTKTDQKVEDPKKVVTERQVIITLQQRGYGTKV